MNRVLISDLTFAFYHFSVHHSPFHKAHYFVPFLLHLSYEDSNNDYFSFSADLYCLQQ